MPYRASSDGEMSRMLNELSAPSSLLSAEETPLVSLARARSRGESVDVSYPQVQDIERNERDGF
jgi:hypothetical protein